MDTNLQRLFQIRDLIKREPDTWTCGKLSVRFGVTKQSIHRDIQKLRKSGVDIQSSYAGYRLISK